MLFTVTSEIVKKGWSKIEDYHKQNKKAEWQYSVLEEHTIERKY